MSATIVSGFPGIGKSYLTKHYKHESLFDATLICSKFFWQIPGSKINPDFPENFILYLKSISNDYEIIFTPFIKSLSDALANQNFKHIVVYPSECLENDYLKRYRRRGDSPIFMHLVSMKWNEYYIELEDLKKYDNIKFVELKDKHAYLQLSDIKE